MYQLKLKAYGKINLGLDVLGKRPDGYHEVRMLMQTVDLYDSIYMNRTKEPGIRLTTNLSYLPGDESNLAYKAAKLLKEECGITDGVEISLRKFLPVAAGMAGGSADCAAVLKGMNELFRLGLSEEELRQHGIRLGADVPYCIMGGTALAEGIGEKLTRLKPVPKMQLVVAKPPVSVSTRFVYTALKADEIVEHPDIYGMIDAIEREDLAGIVSRLGNVLESVTEPVYPVITKLKACMRECGCMGTLMSGSGPTVFGVFQTREEAERAKRTIRERGLSHQAYITSTI